MTMEMKVEHLNQLREIFNRFDMDSDGSLTQLELAAFLRSLGLISNAAGGPLPGDQVRLLLGHMDANGNGLVEFHEMVEAIAPELSRQEELLRLFQAFDQDGNGYITAAELARSMAKLGHALTLRELTDMIREADSDGDGAISFPEFASVMAKSAADSKLGGKF
ncbi:probable calcium-binding protein CML15 [Nymphaea colorata]|uniref:EF-hand domain-containing protein n=1 Tax=Nymphaea colorata TaxID=210225 RepID=A0A5K1GTA6_9MAGN|nr:probable calcium-binding protein CML15 [Nymphaea colorata]